MMTHLHSKRNARGVVAVEFGLVLVPLLLLVCGVAEFGRAIYQYDIMTKATRDSARYLSQYAPDDPTYPTAQAQCLAVYGNTACSGTALVSGLTTSMVVVCDRVNSSGCPGGQYGNVTTYDGSSTPAGTINLVEVKITGFAYSPVQSFIRASGITFSDIATVMRQVL